MKLRKKLLLSCAALAACATTLVSTTYAWYTTNTEVSANELIGASADTGSSSILISGDGGTTWGQSYTFAATAFQDAKLIPLAWDGATKKLKSLDGSTEGTANTDYISFQLHFKTSKTNADVPLYLKSLAVENAADSLTAWDNLLNGQDIADAGIDTNAATYSIDIVKSLAYNIQSTTYDDNDAVAYTPADAWVTAKASTGAPANAHKYYNNVMGLDESEAIATADSSTTVATANTQVALLPADGTPVAITVIVYLNGWDTDCFDACKGQSFKVSFNFTSSNE